MQAAAGKGDITSEFEALKINQNNGSARASGAVGNGASKLHLFGVGMAIAAVNFLSWLFPG